MLFRQIVLENKHKNEVQLGPIMAGIIQCTTENSGSEYVGSMKDVKFLYLVDNQQVDIQSVFKVMIDLAHDMDRQQALINLVVNLGVP